MRHNLKPLVNNNELYQDFVTEIEQRIDVAHKSMEHTSNTESVFRLQGEIKALRKLLKLKEHVNGK